MNVALLSWFSAAPGTLALGLAGAYIKPQLDKWLGRVSVVRKAKNDAARQKLLREARELAASPERLKRAIENEMRARLQINQYLLIGNALLVMVLVVQSMREQARHEFYAYFGAALLTFADVTIVIAGLLAFGVMRATPRLREASRVSENGGGPHRQ